MGIRKVWLSILVVVVIPVARGASWQENIPFKLTRGFGIVVQGDIGPANNLNLLFDTGAVPSVISQRIASRIGVTGTVGPFTLLNKEIETQYLTVSDVRFGSIRVSRLPMVVVDLAPLERVLGIRIDAIIGLDIFAGQSVGIDYKHRKLVPNLGGQTLHETPAEIFRFEGTPYWVLTVDMSGRRFRMLLDTGADNVALFAADMPKSPRRHGREAQVEPNFASASTMQTLQPQNLTIGDMQFKRQLVLVMQEPPNALTKVDGLISPTALGITRLELDWEHKCVRWDRE
jgi:hypothetical protein